MRLGLSLSQSEASSPSAEGSALFARMVPAPSGARGPLIDATIRSLKTAGVWAKLDGLWVTAAHSEQAAQLNWVGATNTLTAVGALPTFTVDRGYQGNGSSQLLTTGFIPGAGKTLRDDHHMGVWVRTTGQDSIAEIGAEMLSITTRQATDLMVSRSASTSTNTVASTDGSGLSLVSRVAGPGYTQYRNGVSLATPVEASVAFGGVFPIYICGRNASGTPAYNAKQIAAASIGGGLSVSEQAALYQALAAYMTAVGAA